MHTVMSDNLGELYALKSTAMVATTPSVLEEPAGENKNRPFVKEKLPVVSERGWWIEGVEDVWDRARRLVGAPKEKKPKFGRWVSVSETSGRTITDALVSKHVVWGGIYSGDIFGAHDVKGSRHDKQSEGIKRDRNGYLGLRAEGMKDEVGNGFIERASLLFRANGLPTECIVKKEKLKEVAVGDGEKWSVGKWKRWALKKFEREVQGNSDNDGFDKKQLVQQAREYLHDNNFYLIERDLQVQERLRDVSLCKTEGEFSNMMGPVFKWLNAATAARGSGLIEGTTKPEDFSLNDVDVKRYFSSWLPEQMGIYVGRMHNLGLTHNFLHAQNWSAVGTVYDLDSVTGRGMPVRTKNEPEAIKGDLKKVMESLEELLDPQNGNYLSNQFGEGLVDQARANFIKNYCKARDLNVMYLDLGGVFRNPGYFDGRKRRGGMEDRDWERALKLVFTD